MISAEVKVPSTGSLTAGPVEVHTYKLLVLKLHAVRRLLDADQVLLSGGNHRATQNSNQRARGSEVARARRARAQAMLELVLHYDLHLAALKVREDEPVEEETSEEEEARSLRDSRLDRAANLGHFGVEAYYSDSNLFLGLHNFLWQPTRTRRAVQGLRRFVQTECRNSPFCDQASLMHVIEGPCPPNVRISRRQGAYWSAAFSLDKTDSLWQCGNSQAGSAGNRYQWDHCTLRARTWQSQPCCP